ncbi:olfactory receptor 1468-like [Pleurodeles waltl]|uniref:olfactory receptor 1468-like n=1 Tax=Pleurodeles waltl TaxID=8319 RepID=UPI0037095249
MLLFFTKFGKDPKKGVDRAWSNCQASLLDLVSPLTRIFDLAEEAKIEGSQVDPDILSNSAQRAICMLGNANSYISQERRKSLLLRIDPKLSSLSSKEEGLNADGLLFGDSFIKEMSKYFSTFNSLDKAHSSMKRIFSNRVFGRAGSVVAAIGVTDLKENNSQIMSTPILESSRNLSDIEFILLGFQILPELQPFFFNIFVMIYISTMTGNVLIIAVVSTESRLHLPMYFFLANLSFLEACYATTIIPTILGGLLANTNTLSFEACMTQFYFFSSFVIAECFLLTVMAYDRYAAICFPLHYTIIMDPQRCSLLALCAWIPSYIIASITNSLVCDLCFPTENEIDHFFCDYEPLLKSACSDIYFVQTETFIMSSLITSIPFILIIVSYTYIIAAILRMTSTTGRYTAFSTCSSHLIVVVAYFGTLIGLYVLPTTGQPINLKKTLSLLYTVATPLLNPIIYTLRNRDIKETLVTKFTCRKQ